MTKTKWVKNDFNEFLKGDGFYISYNPDTGADPLGKSINDLGSTLGALVGEKIEGGSSEETALCKGDKFYILNGDFRKDYEALVSKGFKHCLNFFLSKEKKYGSGWTTSREFVKKLNKGDESETKVKIDEFGQVENCFESAEAVHMHLFLPHETGGAAAFQLALDGYTALNVVFVYVDKFKPHDAKAWQGGKGDVHVNFERLGTGFTFDSRQAPTSLGYLMEKMGLQEGDAKPFLPFLNSVLTGKNHFNKKED